MQLRVADSWWDTRSWGSNVGLENFLEVKLTSKGKNQIQSIHGLNFWWESWWDKYLVIALICDSKCDINDENIHIPSR